MKGASVYLVALFILINHGYVGIPDQGSVHITSYVVMTRPHKGCIKGNLVVSEQHVWFVFDAKLVMSDNRAFRLNHIQSNEVRTSEAVELQEATQLNVFGWQFHGDAIGRHPGTEKVLTVSQKLANHHE